MQQDNNQKTVNGAGWFFIICLAVHVLGTFCMSILEQKGIDIPMELQLIISELTILTPTLIFALKKKMSFREDFGFCKIKVGTIFMSVLLSVLITPVATFVNLLSQLFVPNTMVQASNELFSGSALMILFLSSIYGPFCEELCFRSAILRRYEKGSGFIRAVLISSLFFGLLHLNVNQACYAFVLGILFSIINKASGSVYTSMIIHTCVNGGNMLMLFFSLQVSKLSGAEMDVAAAAESVRGATSFMYIMIGIFLVLALGGLAISVPCVIWMAKHEGHLEEFKSAFSKNKDPEKKKVRAFFNVPTIIATVVAAFLVFGLGPMMAYLGLQ